MIIFYKLGLKVVRFSIVMFLKKWGRVEGSFWEPFVKKKRTTEKQHSKVFFFNAPGLEPEGLVTPAQAGLAGWLEGAEQGL